MISICNTRPIEAHWTVYRSMNAVLERFERANLHVFLIGDGLKTTVPHSISDGNIVVSIPSCLADGTYSLEAIWSKNWLLPEVKHDERLFHCNNVPGRNVSKSRKDSLFRITSYPEEETPGLGETVILRLKSGVASYGYDGLGIYELAVMYGKFNGTEEDFVGRYIDSVDRMSEELIELRTMVEEIKRQST